jgi:hypothetical protein
MVYCPDNKSISDRTVEETIDCTILASQKASKIVEKTFDSPETATLGEIGFTVFVIIIALIIIASIFGDKRP